jgi:hypothetical protein
LRRDLPVIVEELVQLPEVKNTAFFFDFWHKYWLLNPGSVVEQPR